MADAIEKIGYRAFANCPKLESINIPLNWKECSSSSTADEGIGYKGSIFSECYELVQLEIPEGVTKIPAYAFCDCSYLREIYLPESLLAIGKYSFYGCSNLTSINLPTGVTVIPDSAFANCSALLAINIPETISTIEEGAFDDCFALAAINYSASNSSWSSISIDSWGNEALNSVYINYTTLQLYK